MKKLDFVLDSHGNRILVGECFQAVTSDFHGDYQVHQYRFLGGKFRDDGRNDFKVDVMSDYPVRHGWTTSMNPDGTPKGFDPGEFDRLTCRTCPLMLTCIVNGQFTDQQ